MGLMVALPAGMPALAAREGGIAGQSKGDIAITASVRGSARLYASADTIGDDGGVPFCLAANTATRSISITATNDGAAGGLVVSADGGALRYSVRWAGAALAPGATLPNRGAANCAAAGATGRLIVVSAHHPGTRYSGTLSLLVAPE